MKSTVLDVKKLYKLKEIYRANSVGDRKESAAEHSWSCLLLADFFLDNMKEKLDRLKIYEILIYHDIVEIHAGDIPIHHEEKRKDKEKAERLSLERLKTEIPAELGNRLGALFVEFEEGKTREARFAKAIDKLDATLHEMDYKQDWKGWTEEQVRKYNDLYFEEFPEIKEAHDLILEYARKHGYFDQ